MIFPGITFFVALSASVKNAINPAPPPPPPSFGTTAVLKIVNTVRNLDIATMVGLKPPPPPPDQGFGAVFAKAWEDPRSLIPSSSDLTGVVEHVYSVYKSTTIPSTSDVVAALGDIRNVKLVDLRQRFKVTLPPPPPPSFPSKAWFQNIFKVRAAPPPPPFLSWARFHSYLDIGAVIAKVRGITPPPPPSRRERTMGRIQMRYTTMIMPHTSKLVSKLGELCGKAEEISRGFRAIANSAAANTTAQATSVPLPSASNSTAASPLSWLKSIRVPSSSNILDEAQTAPENAANPTLSDIRVNEFRMKVIKNARAWVADVMGTSMGMRLLPTAALKGDQVDLSTGGVLDEPAQFVEDSDLKALLQASYPGPIKEQTLTLGLIQEGLCGTVFKIGFALGYAHAFLIHAFPMCRIWKWVQFFSCMTVFFVFVFLWNWYVDYWVQCKEEKKAAEEEERRRKENPPRADSSFYYWTRYTPAQEQAILDAVR